jgi:hypothetical protein
VAETADKVRVFSEGDVQAILERVVQAADLASHDDMLWLRKLGAAALEEYQGELTEEVFARSEVRRLVALALAWGDDGMRRGEARFEPGLPAEVWDELHDRGLLHTGRDVTGEGWTHITSQGVEHLLARLLD